MQPSHCLDNSIKE